MNRRLTRSFLILATAADLTSAAEMTARFRNGDTLPGRFAAFENGTVQWSSPAFFEPQPLLLPKLDDVLLPAPDAAALPDGDHLAVVTLTNGDRLEGSLLHADDKTIRLLTSFAGELAFDRRMVSTVEIRERPLIYYAGPNSIDEWTRTDPDSWTMDNDGLLGLEASGIARDVGIHERFSLSFDVSWRGSARFRVFTCADSTDLEKVGNCFELVCQSQYAYIRKRMSRNGGAEAITIGTTGGVREFQEREKVRIRLLQDLIDGRIRLMIDGRVVADWREPAPGAGNLGGALHFVSDHRSPLRISRIQMTSWDGVIEDSWQEQDPFAAGFDGFNHDEDEEAAPPDITGILLANGDLVDGRASGVAEGTVTLETPLKTFTLPVSRLRSFALRTAEEAADPELTWKPIRRAGDIRAWFPDGHHLTFELLGYEDGKLTGRSQTFGEAGFELSAFSRIEFNLYRSPYTP